MKSLKKQLGFTAMELVWVIMVVMVLVGTGGWIANIVKIFGSNFSDLTGELVLRIVGVFLAPLGAVMGFL